MSSLTIADVEFCTSVRIEFLSWVGEIYDKLRAARLPRRTYKKLLQTLPVEDIDGRLHVYTTGLPVEHPPVITKRRGWHFIL